MKRETLLRTKSVMHKMDFYPSSQLVHSLVDSHLEALDKIEELARTIERVEGLAAAFDREAARPDNTVAPVARGIAASIRSALRGGLGCPARRAATATTSGRCSGWAG